MVKLSVATAISILAVCGEFVFGTGDRALSPPYTCTTTTTLCHPGEARDNNLSVDFGSDPQYGRPGKRGLRGPKGDKGDSCDCVAGGGSSNLPRPTAVRPSVVKGVKGEKGEPGSLERASEELEQMRRRIEKLEANAHKVHASGPSATVQDGEITSHGQFSQFPTKCSELRNGSNIDRAIIYPLVSFHDITPFVVNCREGQWIPIQRRINGSVDFYRDWREYVEGFGDKDGEFWLGLKNIHRLTSQAPYELYIDMKRRDNGASIFARYGVFFVDNEASKFRLIVGDYSGNYGDRLRYHNGLRFSTRDEDLDEHSSNCAQTNKGAWWYKGCRYSNLNGQYSGNYIYWGVYLSFSEMKIRPRC